MRQAVRLFVLSAVVLGASTTAHAAIIYATGQGWCSNSEETCNNKNATVLADTFAGHYDDPDPDEPALDYRNWFAFDIPFFGDAILTATLHIWNPEGNDTADGSATYSVYQALDGALTFGSDQATYTHLTTGGGPFGSVMLVAANAGPSQYIGIPLNVDGVAAIEAAQGLPFVFGGAVFRTLPGVEIFGYGQAPDIFNPDETPVRAAYLELQTASTTAVPEPATLMLLGTGALGLLARARRRTKRS